MAFEIWKLGDEGVFGLGGPENGVLFAVAQAALRGERTVIPVEDAIDYDLTPSGDQSPQRLVAHGDTAILTELAQTGTTERGGVYAHVSWVALSADRSKGLPFGAIMYGDFHPIHPVGSVSIITEVWEQAIQAV
jgi:hypothetical protein